MKKFISLLLTLSLIFTTTIVVSAAEYDSSGVKAEQYPDIIEAEKRDLQSDYLDLLQETTNFSINSLEIIEENIIIENTDVKTYAQEEKEFRAEDITLTIGGVSVKSNFESKNASDIVILDNDQISDIMVAEESKATGSSSSKANGADLTVSLLAANNSYTNSSGYFTPYTLAGVDFTISNIGNTTASNVRVDMYFNGQNMGAFIIPSLLWNRSISDTIEIGNVPPGTYTLQLVIDRYNSISELNENNNSLSKSFTWQALAGQPDLVSTITSVSPTILAGVEQTLVNFAIHNSGSADIIQTFLVTIYYDNTPMGSLPVNGLRAGRTTSGQFYFSSDIYAYGDVELRCWANSNYAASESNYSNNNSYDTVHLTANYKFRGDETFRLTWLPNYSNLSVRIYDSLLNSYNYSNSQWTSVVTGNSGWNGYNANTRFGSLTLGGSFDIATNPPINYNVEVVGANYSYLGDDGRAYCAGPDDGFSHNFYYVEINNSGQFSRPERDALYALRHELGHVCGLDHPDNYGLAESSVMYVSGPPYASSSVSSSDILNMKYVR